MPNESTPITVYRPGVISLYEMLQRGGKGWEDV